MSEHRCPRSTPRGDGYKATQQLCAPKPRLLAGPNEMRGLMLKKTANGTTVEPTDPRAAKKSG